MRIAAIYLFLLGLAPSAIADVLPCAPHSVRAQTGQCRTLPPSGGALVTMHASTWGTAFYHPDIAMPRENQPARLDVLVTKAGGEVRGQEVLGGYRFELGSDRLEIVPGNGASWTVRKNGSVLYQLDVQPHGVLLRAGGTQVSYQRTGILGPLTVRGPAGQTFLDYSGGRLAIKSTGKVTNVQLGLPHLTLDIKGAPVNVHPHVGRAMYVTLGPVGLMIDLWRLAGFEAPEMAEAALDWPRPL